MNLSAKLINTIVKDNAAAHSENSSDDQAEPYKLEI